MDEKYRTFLFSYRHDGAVWVLEIKARDLDDAWSRLAKIQYASYDGELKLKVPVPAGMIARLAVWLARVIGRPPVGQTSDL